MDLGNELIRLLESFAPAEQTFAGCVVGVIAYVIGRLRGKQGKTW